MVRDILRNEMVSVLGTSYVFVGTLLTAIFISIRKREFRRAVLRKAEPLCGALPSHGNHLNVYVMSHFSIILCEGQKIDLK